MVLIAQVIAVCFSNFDVQKGVLQRLTQHRAYIKSWQPRREKQAHLTPDKLIAALPNTECHSIQAVLCYHVTGQVASNAGADLHSAVVCSSDARRAAIKDNTLVWWTPQLDGGRQEPLADGVHAILGRHKGLEELAQLQPIKNLIDCQPAPPTHVTIGCFLVGQHGLAVTQSFTTLDLYSTVDPNCNTVQLTRTLPPCVPAHSSDTFVQTNTSWQITLYAMHA